MRNGKKRSHGVNFLKKKDDKIDSDSNKKSKINLLRLSNFQTEKNDSNFLENENLVEVILIFYCEFSSERGPKMYNFFRNQDRSVNRYPKLHYPQTYVMEGGFSKFHDNFKYFCNVKPQEKQNYLEEKDQYVIKEQRKKREQEYLRDQKMKKKKKKNYNDPKQNKKTKIKVAKNKKIQKVNKNPKLIYNRRNPNTEIKYKPVMQPNRIMPQMVNSNRNMYNQRMPNVYYSNQRPMMYPNMRIPQQNPRQNYFNMQNMMGFQRMGQGYQAKPVYRNNKVNIQKIQVRNQKNIVKKHKNSKRIVVQKQTRKSKKTKNERYLSTKKKKKKHKSKARKDNKKNAKQRVCNKDSNKKRENRNSSRYRRMDDPKYRNEYSREKISSRLFWRNIHEKASTQSNKRPLSIK
jgi:hypothetical protein